MFKIQSATNVSINKLHLMKQFKSITQFLKMTYIEGFNDYIINMLIIQVI